MISFSGFDADLRAQTGGQAFPQCVFDHWQQLVGEVYTEGSKLNEVIKGLRKRKNLSEELPTYQKYHEKL